MAPRRIFAPDPGFGVGTMFQAIPFQCSASVFPFAPSRTLVLFRSPTTQTSFDPMTASSFRKALLVPEVGVGTIFQLDPFQRSMSPRETPFDTM